MAPKSFVRLREVVYTLSPFETKVMGGLFKDLPGKMATHWKNWGQDAVIFCGVPYAATLYYAQAYVDAEEMHHRF